MATTTTISAANPRTIQLSNGKAFTFTDNAATKEEAIPVIDVSRMYSDKLEDKQALAEEIRDAAHRIGFLCVVNHVSVISILFPFREEGGSKTNQICIYEECQHEPSQRSAIPSQRILFLASRKENGRTH